MHGRGGGGGGDDWRLQGGSRGGEGVGVSRVEGRLYRMGRVRAGSGFGGKEVGFGGE